MGSCSSIKISLCAIFMSAALSSCVLVPKQVVSYSDECQMYTKKYELTAQELSLLPGSSCTSQSCDTAGWNEVATVVIIGAAATLVSGSIVATGNAARSLKDKHDCSKSKVRPGKVVQIAEEQPDDPFALTEEVVKARF